MLHVLIFTLKLKVVKHEDLFCSKLLFFPPLFSSFLSHHLLPTSFQIKWFCSVIFYSVNILQPSVQFSTETNILYIFLLSIIFLRAGPVCCVDGSEATKGFGGHLVFKRGLLILVDISSSVSMVSSRSHNHSTCSTSLISASEHMEKRFNSTSKHQQNTGKVLMPDLLNLNLGRSVMCTYTRTHTKYVNPWNNAL